ncbi:MAG: hypothetical protein L0229_02525 [Blastocatellia bacterium]|nr:hypothetical protein [Blastocatellia bacterium]
MSQYDHREQHRQRTDIDTPVRLRYFYGMLLDKYHFELEQEYFNDKRWLLNRLVTGPGVVCGLDVQLYSDGKSIVVLPGLAIDRCGREMVVARPSDPVALPIHLSQGDDYKDEDERGHEYRRDRQHRHHCEDEYAHVALCYHECASDPVPVVAGGCDEEGLCAPSTVRELYEIKIRDGKAPERKSSFPDVIEGRRINHAAVVEFVTRGCRKLPDDCCIPLADVRLREAGEESRPEDIDITIRPIVYTNRLLFYLLQSLVMEDINGY